MKNTGFRLFLRVWVALASLGAFIGGWVFLGHSGKPVSASLLNTQPGDSGAQNQQLAPLPTLAPLPSLDKSAAGNRSNNFGLQPAQQQPAFQFAQPRLRTRGS